MKRLLIFLIAGLIGSGSINSMELPTIATTSNEPLLQSSDSSDSTDSSKPNDINIPISEENSEKENRIGGLLTDDQKSRLQEALIACASGSAALTLNNFVPAASFLAFSAWGASLKVCMRKLPTPAKIGAGLTLAAAGYALDKYLLPQFIGISDVGFLPLGLTGTIIVIKKSIKENAKKKDKAEKKQKKEKPAEYEV